MQEQSYSDSFRYIILPDGDRRLTNKVFLASLGHPQSCVVRPFPIHKDHPTDPMREGEFTGFWKIKVVVGAISIKKGITIPAREQKPLELNGLTEHTADELKAEIVKITTDSR